MRSFDEPLIFVGGSDVNWKVLKSQTDFPIVAVDGGGNDLFKHGLNPNYLCGDFDSINSKAYKRIELEGAEIVALPDQNRTDFAKAIDAFDTPVIYAYGFLDGRFDHGLDALAQLGNFPGKRIYLIGMNDIAFSFPSGGEMQILRENRISFWSAGETQIHESHGLKWPLDGTTIDASRMSISNKMVDDLLRITYTGAPLIAICPVDAMRLI